MNIKCVSLLVQQEIQSLYEVGTAFIPFENIGYPGKKPVFSARLRQLFICTQLERLQFILYLVSGSQHQDGDSGFIL